MGKGRNKGMKRSHMKRFASDNIQVKSSTRHKAAMAMRPMVINPKPFAIGPDQQAYLDRVFPGQVVMTGAKQAVIARRNQLLNHVNPERCLFLFEGKVRTVQMYFTEDMKCVHLVEINHSLKKVRKSITYNNRHKCKQDYLDGRISWKPYQLIDPSQDNSHGF